MLTKVSIFFIFITFIFGLFIGSFLNVLADRFPNDRSILGRSSCDYCHKTLTWKDLIPLISYIYLKGKCRYCHKSFSIQYPLLELITGGFFVLTTVITFSNSSYSSLFFVNLIFNLMIVSSFIAIFFADLRYGIIPDEINIFLAVIISIWLIIFNQPLIINHLLSAIGAFLFFLFIFMATKGRGMGFGDVKLAGVLGLLLGFPGVGLTIYLAFLTGGIVGIILILWKKKRMKSAVPFGPFLILGAFISLFFSPVILPRIMALLL